MRWRLILVLTPLLAFASCTEIANFLGLNKDYFADYRGVNLLKEFDLPKWTTSTMGLVTAGVDDYMIWEAVTSETAPDGTSPVYRVEIKNLLPNGDFEAGSLGSYWGTTEASALPVNIALNLSTAHADNQQPPVVAIPASVQTINHQSLLFAANDGGDYANLDLKAALGSLWKPGQYRFRMSLINVTTSTKLHVNLIDPVGTLGVIDAEKSGIWDRTDLDPVNQTSLQEISSFFTVGDAATERVVRFGDKTNTDAAILDNFRLVLANQDLSAVAIFPSLNILPNLPLLPGQTSKAYTFKIYIKDDATADQSSGSHVANRFYPSGVTISILGKDKNAATLKSLARVFFPRPPGGWTTWTMVSHFETIAGTGTPVEVEGISGGLDFVTSDADLDGQNALEIHISPTNQIDLSTDGKDVGSVLLAQPSFTFNP